MKIGLHAQLGLGIIVVFGLILAGYYMYEPLEFAYYKNQIMSNDPAVVESAAADIAVKRKSAIPYLRKWLDSPSDKLVAGAMLAVEKMEGDLWREFQPEIETILARSPSDSTELAARIIVLKRKEPIEKYAGKYPYSVRRNIYLWCAFHDRDSSNRLESVYGLTNQADAYTLKALFRILEINIAADELDMECDAGGDYYAKEFREYMRAHAAINLFEMCSNRPGPAIFAALEKARENHNEGAAIALAWMRGGADIQKARTCENRDYSIRYKDVFLELAEIRWGNSSAISGIIEWHKHPWANLSTAEFCYKGLIKYLKDVKDMLPENFPHIEKDGGIYDAKLLESLIKWYEENKSLLVWDAEKRKYYLKPE
jgi:hypothetical protein